MPSEVSVIIPTHNRKELLIRAIKSVLDQSYQDFEIIVVDDLGVSEDCVDFDPRIKYFRVKSDGYIAYSRNIGIYKSEGKYIAFLDDDDIWLPGKLEKQIKKIQIPGTVMCLSGMNTITEVNGIPTPDRIHSKTELHGNLLNMFIMNAHFGTPTVIARHSVFNKVGTFFVDPQMKVGEDVDMFLRIASSGNVYYDPAPSVNRLINLLNGDNMSRTVSTTQRTSSYAFRAIQMAYERLLTYPLPVSSRLLTHFQILNYQTKIIHDKFKGEWKP